VVSETPRVMLGKEVIAMSRGRSRIFNAAQCAQLWRRYKAGESILGIGRALCGRASAVRRVLECTGGIAPPQRRRSSKVLSLVEREEISRGIAAGYTFRAIAKCLKRAVSTVSQEVGRHGGGSATGPLKPTWQLGIARVAQSPACSFGTDSCSGSLRLN
jgi:hypothetical protein